MNFSMTFVGLIIIVLAFIAKSIGVELTVTEDDIVRTIGTIAQAIGLAVAYYGRYRHGDITIWGTRKKPLAAHAETEHSLDGSSGQ